MIDWRPKKSFLKYRSKSIYVMLFLINSAVLVLLGNLVVSYAESVADMTIPVGPAEQIWSGKVLEMYCFGLAGFACFLDVSYCLTTSFSKYQKSWKRKGSLIIENKKMVVLLSIVIALFLVLEGLLFADFLLRDWNTLDGPFLGRMKVLAVGAQIILFVMVFYCRLLSGNEINSDCDDKPQEFTGI